MGASLAESWVAVYIASSLCTVMLVKWELHVGVGSAAYTDDFLLRFYEILVCCTAGCKDDVYHVMCSLCGECLEKTLSDLSTKLIIFLLNN